MHSVLQPLWPYFHICMLSTAAGEPVQFHAWSSPLKWRLNEIMRSGFEYLQCRLTFELLNPHLTNYLKPLMYYYSLEGAFIMLKRHFNELLLPLPSRVVTSVTNEPSFSRGDWNGNSSFKLKSVGNLKLAALLSYLLVAVRNKLSQMQYT